MRLDFKENDIVEFKEKVLSDTIFEKNTANAEVARINKYIDNEDRFMLQTIMSTLYKLRSKRAYMMGRIPGKYEQEENTIWETEIIIKIFYEALKENRFDKIKNFLNETKKNNLVAFLFEKKSENRRILSKLLYDYYYDKNTNYIGEKFYLYNIIKQKNIKETLALNPYMISQFFDYQQKPLTKEELIIQEIMDYNKEAEWRYLDTTRIMKYVISLFEYNNQRPNSKETKLLFIISNVLQESKERKDKFYGKLMWLLENSKYDPEIIINYLSKNKDMLIEIMKKFTDYNREIKEGRLEQLEKKSSAEIAQKIYRKNP